MQPIGLQGTVDEQLLSALNKHGKRLLVTSPSDLGDKRAQGGCRI